MWILKSSFLKLISKDDQNDKSVQEKLKKKGKRCHLPALNLNETVFVDRLVHVGSQNKVAAAASALHSPANPMPVANAETVYRHWARWTANSAERSGHGIDRNGVINKKLRDAPWRTLVMQKDNLVLNNCLVAL